MVYTALQHGIIKLNYKRDDSIGSPKYRPFIDVLFCQGVEEKVVAFRLTDCIFHYILVDLVQQAYEACHFTETALLHIPWSVLEKLNEVENSLVVGLDFFATIDMLDNDDKEERISKFSVHGKTLADMTPKYRIELNQY